jgi:hypothetical protein
VLVVVASFSFSLITNTADLFFSFLDRMPMAKSLLKTQSTIGESSRRSWLHVFQVVLDLLEDFSSGSSMDKQEVYFLS